jgi:CBS domain containing-hemolysin-like protein
MRMFATTQRSRIPVYEGSLDHILGFVHIKDMIWILLDRTRTAEERQPLVDDRQPPVNDRQPPVNDRRPPVNEREPQVDDRQPVPEFNLRTMLRDVLIVPETKRASELLLEFRARRTGLAMIVDEFGSILGLATLEDILEQMVGEIHDEFDVVERPLTLADGSMIFDGATNVRDLESQYSIKLPEDSSYETVGGFILDHLGFIPRGGESFEAHGFRFTVMEMEHRRVSRVKIKSVRPVDPPVADQPSPRTSAALANSAEESAASSTGAEKHPRKEIAKARRAASASNVRRDK